jgi:hypothetical protein
MKVKQEKDLHRKTNGGWSKIKWGWEKVVKREFFVRLVFAVAD